MTLKLDYGVHCRFDLIAQERAIPLSEIRGACRTEGALHAFIRRHLLSYDWVLLGDVRGLHRQERWRRAGRVY